MPQERKGQWEVGMQPTLQNPGYRYVRMLSGDAAQLTITVKLRLLFQAL